MAKTSYQNHDRIYRLQRRTARLIFDTDYKHPSLPLFEKLGWLQFIIVLDIFDV